LAAVRFCLLASAKCLVGKVVYNVYSGTLIKPCTICLSRGDNSNQLLGGRRGGKVELCPAGWQCLAPVLGQPAVRSAKYALSRTVRKCERHTNNSSALHSQPLYSVSL